MKVPILGTNVSCTDYQSSTARIIRWAEMGESRVVCAANVHVIMEAHDHSEFQQMLNSADMVTSDGMPLVWTMRLKGINGQERVYGPDLMLAVLAAASEQAISVGFLGSTEEVLRKLAENMTARFPGLQIGVKISPPFRTLTSEEDDQITQQINASGVRILFVGLGCPKQERWMAEHKERVNAVLIGVGAAYDFHAGMVRQAPHWMQQLGLEWLFRLIQEPRRLWRRYLWNNPRFVVLILGELIRERLILKCHKRG